jgi:hypothetical protein
MTKYYILVVSFLFQTMLPMELTHVRQRSLSINDETIQKKPLILPISQLPKRLEVNLALLSFDQMRTWFEARPVECQHAAKKLLSPNMLLIHDFVMQPEDVIKNTVFLMFGAREENKGAIEEFLNTPIAEALRLYHEVRNGLVNSDKPMGPLYTMSQAKRDFVLQALNPWYYSHPFYHDNNRRKNECIDEDMKLYLDDIIRTPLSYGMENDYKLCSGITCGVLRLNEGREAIAGATCAKYGGVQCMCAGPFLKLVFRMSGCVGMSMEALLASIFCCNALTGSQKKTL